MRLYANLFTNRITSSGQATEATQLLFRPNRALPVVHA
jgi:hypothetical protein